MPIYRMLLESVHFLGAGETTQTTGRHHFNNPVVSSVFLKTDISVYKFTPVT